MTNNTMASNWGTIKAGDDNGKKAYLKYKTGKNTFRICGNILPRFVYWLTGQKENDEGVMVSMKAAFDCLSFDPKSENFMNGAPDAVKDLGIQNTTFKGDPEFDKKGAPVPLKPQRMYQFPVINRDSGEYEYATLKGDTLVGIGELMTKLNDPKQRRRWVNPEYVVNSPCDIDIILVKSGAGLGTKYKVDVVETLEYMLDEDMHKAMIERFAEDEAILADKKPIEEVFPRPTYTEQKEAIDKFLNGTPEDENGEPKEPAQGSSEAEAVSDLD